MAIAHVRTKFTYEDYCRLPEDQRYEVIDGDLFVTPSPGIPHQRISGKIDFLIRKWVMERGLGEVFAAPLFGVREYWIVDPKEKTIALFTLQGRRLVLKRTVTRGQVFQSRILVGFRVSLGDIF